VRADVRDALFRLALRLAYRGFRAYALVFRPTMRGSAVLVRWDGRLLMIRTSYETWYKVPGGMPRRGEAPEATAARELREETGIHARPEELRPLGELVVEYSRVKDHVHFFELSCAHRPEVRVDRREVIWAEFRAEDEVGELPLWPPLETLLRRG
jgi:8-oxo-dGTP pyrophosphatase MutT (NUDIX family)